MRGGRRTLRIATWLVAILAAVSAIAVRAALPDQSLAAANQISVFEDDPAMMADPFGTVQRLRMLGAQEIRVAVRWQYIAPNPSSRRRPARFRAFDPAAYPARNWKPFDAIATAASQAGLRVLFDVVGGAPLWATGPGAPVGKSSPFYQWEPSASEYGQFVHALGTRYSGRYDAKLKKVAPGNPNDLPAVTSWSIWNEPDYGPSLAPQGLPGALRTDHAPEMYRALVQAGWNALHLTGHGRDTFLFGEVAPRGVDRWGVFQGIKPLVFLRSLYCVDGRYRPLRGAAAAVRGCPTTAAGSRRFRAANPALFGASGFADHPYMRWYPPNREAPPDPNYSSLGEIGTLEHALDRLQAAYGSHTRLPIYDTEFGYLTSPPKHDSQLERNGHRYPWVSQRKAAYYLNWAEYLHWRDPRLRSYAQYLLYDPLPALRSNDWGGFASGLINYGPGQTPKPTYYAWRLPIHLPVTAARAGRALEVWGCVRPAPFAVADTGLTQTAQIQFANGSSSAFRTIQSVPLSSTSNCYFDVRVKFPASGTVRLAWRYSMPGSSSSYLYPLSGATAYSRSVQIAVR